MKANAQVQIAESFNTTLANALHEAFYTNKGDTMEDQITENTQSTSTLADRIANMGDIVQSTTNRIVREVESNLESYIRRCDEKNKPREERVSYSFGLSQKQSGVAKQICETLKAQGVRVTLRKFSDLEREGRNALRTHIVITVNVPKK